MLPVTVDSCNFVIFVSFDYVVVSLGSLPPPNFRGQCLPFKHQLITRAGCQCGVICIPFFVWPRRAVAVQPAGRIGDIRGCLNIFSVERFAGNGGGNC